MNRFIPRFDLSILVCILILLGFGLSTIASVAPEVLGNQIIFALIGLILFFVFSRIDYRVYGSLSKVIYFASLILLGITLFLGYESNGAVRWIALGPFRFQFSEILKPFFVTCFASFLLTRPKRNFFHFLTLALIFAIPTFMVFRQPDLGSALVFVFGSVVMLFLSQINLIYLAASAVGSLLILPVFWHFLADYQKKRILTFLSPQSDPLGSSYNAIQASITVGSGMLFGRGLGRGTQSHLLFLPEHHTDFIFASIAEELGFVGSISIVAVYFFLIWKIFSISLSEKDPYARLISAGIGAFLLSQVFINIGMNIGILPVTGITLPLVSYGGSSVLATMIALGIVANISSSQKEENTLHIV